jgi:hypothetical protein
MWPPPLPPPNRQTPPRPPYNPSTKKIKWFKKIVKTKSGTRKHDFANQSRVSVSALQIILDLCIPEIELADARSQISFIYFQSHSWYSVRNYKIPKGIMKTRFEPRLPRMSSHGKKINFSRWIWTQAPCITSQYLATRPRATRPESPCRYWSILEPLMCGVQLRAHWGNSTSLWYPVVLNRTSNFLQEIFFRMWNLELRYGYFLLESCDPNLN